ncbi:MAG: hypothetical protein JXA09_13750 [Anaerolineae bacterium]|nr:hypothetical protein [Anaerolineae bacterium]
MRRFLGLLHYLAYKANHHFFMRISLRNWLWVLLVLPPAAAWLRRLPWSYAIALSALGALLLAGLEWSRRKGYLIFEPGPLPSGADGLPAIVVDEQVPCLASGRFAVSDNERGMVNERAQVSFVRTREHVVMVRLQRTRFLLLTRSLEGEQGWWYVFFAPRQVQRVETGRLIAGLRARPALAIHYTLPEGARGTDTVYLAFPNPDDLQRVLDELRTDVPVEAFGGF